MAQFFNQGEIDEFKECFNMYAKTGYITSVPELSRIMRSLGMAPTTAELASYYKGKEISFPVFLDIMHRHKQYEKPAADILAAFRALDKRHRGEMSAKDLRHFLMNTGEKMSKKDVDAVLREGNISSNGIFNYADFVKFFAEPVPDY
ncbi:putative Calmodulin-like protein 4 [Hypsibius exemplaris]|uniref:Calmodulin-like protein 4 n=1 Tax=Hypsibius exemplaris TaxID=2072580 RepID=A0A1W0XB73_HYPEX|nr:putative Calmodulin-like protein 4 [Hypsibius exemplaris]